MEPISIGAAASVINVTVKIFQFSYEIKAVGEKVRDLLETTNAITKTLETAQTLLHQKSHLFSDVERTWMTDVAFAEARRSLKKVAALIESARCDISVTHGRVGFGTRFMYVMKESPKLIESLASLTLAGQLLTQAMGIICNRGGEQSSRLVVDGIRSPSLSGKPPPSYAESEFLNQHRRSTRRDAPPPPETPTPCETPRSDLIKDTASVSTLALDPPASPAFFEYSQRQEHDSLKILAEPPTFASTDSNQTRPALPHANKSRRRAFLEQQINNPK